MPSKNLKTIKEGEGEHHLAILESYKDDTLKRDMLYTASLPI